MWPLDQGHFPRPLDQAWEKENQGYEKKVNKTHEERCIRWKEGEGFRVFETIQREKKKNPKAKDISNSHLLIACNAGHFDICNILCN